MCARKDSFYDNRLITAGMFFLVAGGISLRFMPRWSRITPDLAVLLTGLPYGLAIGCLLVGIAARGRPAR
jgi:hypothetical protein